MFQGDRSAFDMARRITERGPSGQTATSEELRANRKRGTRPARPEAKVKDALVPKTALVGRQGAAAFFRPLQRVHCTLGLAT